MGAGPRYQSNEKQSKIADTSSTRATSDTSSTADSDTEQSTVGNAAVQEDLFGSSPTSEESSEGLLDILMGKKPTQEAFQGAGKEVEWNEVFDEDYWTDLECLERYTPMPDTPFMDPNSGEQSNARPSDLSEFTPEYVEANRDALGIPRGAPISDFFTEFVAHQVTGSSGRRSDRQNQIDRMPGNPSHPAYDPNNEDANNAYIEAQTLYDQERSMLEAWGYAPDVSREQEVVDPETGLYVVRYDPLPGYEVPKALQSEEMWADGGQSVTSFRGTQPTEGLDGSNHRVGQDIFTDLDPEVGARQYNANETAIQKLMENGTNADQSRGTVTGHSLGGYLAQRAAAENTDTISNVVSFQAGGIDDDHAQTFRENNADGHVDVRHHTTNFDFVHWAGEEKLGGTHFDHITDDLDRGNFGHLRGLMFGVDENGPEGALNILNSKQGTIESDEDIVSENWRHLSEGMRLLAGGVGQVLGSGVGGYHQMELGMSERDAAAVSRIGKTSARFNEDLTEINNSTDAAMGNVSEAWSNGEYLDAMGAAGAGAIDVTGDAARTAIDLAGNIGGGAVDYTAGTLGSVGDGIATGVGMLGTGAWELFNSASHLVQAGAGFAEDADVDPGDQLTLSAWDHRTLYSLFN